MKSMYPTRHRLSRIQKQQGSMLFISVFVIVIMAMLGLTMTNLLATSAESVVYESLGLKAMNAAKSGLEVRISAAFPLASSSAVATCEGAVGDAVAKDLSTVNGLEGCSYSTQCQTDTSSSLIQYYRFSSTGQCIVSDVVVSRTIAVDARTL